MPPEGFTPIKLIHDPYAGKGIKSLSIQFCLVRYDYLKFDPKNIAPFHSNLIDASGCNEGSRSAVTIKMEHVIPAVAHSLGGVKSSEWNGLPKGVVLHVARCGSTAIANTFGATPNAIALSEPEFINEAFDLRQFNVLTRQEALLVLRVLTQLTSSGAREMALRAGGNLFSQDSSLLMKLSSNTPLFLQDEDPLQLLAEAWPATRWAFVVRDPVAVVSAQLTTSFSEFMSEDISPRVASARAPCLRSRVIQSQFVEDTLQNLTGRSSSEFSAKLGHLALTMEAYCALHTASIYRGVLDFDQHLRETRENTHEEQGGGGSEKRRRRSVAVRTKQQQSPQSGVLIIDHAELPGAVMGRLMPHFGFDVESFSRDQLDMIAKVGKTYSKNGANTSDYSGKDSTDKRAEASHAVRYWAERLTLPLYSRTLERRCENFDVCSEGATVPVLGDRQSSSSDERTSDDDGHGEDDDWELGVSEEEPQKDLDFTVGNLLFSGGIVEEGVSREDVLFSDGKSALSKGFPLRTKPMTCSKSIVRGTGKYSAFAAYSDFSRLSVLAMEHFQSGSWLMADACWRYALTEVETDMCHNGSTTCVRINRQSVLENLGALEDSISRASGARIWHGKLPILDQFKPDHPTEKDMNRMWEKMTSYHKEELGHSDTIDFADGVEVYDDMLSAELCEYIIELFERSDEKYHGNVLRQGRAEVDDSVKSTREIDIGNSRFPIWHAVEWTLLQALTAAMARYETRYPGYTFLPNPLHEDGFRVKKYETARVKETQPEYQNEGQVKGGSHNWHVDSSDAQNCRKIAVIFYLNDVEEGGETLFLTPRPRVVRPKRGSIALFPAGPSHYHAGARVESQPKYGISNFISVCDLDAALGVPVRPPLNRTALALARTYFKTPPASWKRNNEGKQPGRIEF